MIRYPDSALLTQAVIEGTTHGFMTATAIEKWHKIVESKFLGKELRECYICKKPANTMVHTGVTRLRENPKELFVGAHSTPVCDSKSACAVETYATMSYLYELSEDYENSKVVGVCCWTCRKQPYPEFVVCENCKCIR